MRSFAAGGERNGSGANDGSRTAGAAAVFAPPSTNPRTPRRVPPELEPAEISRRVAHELKVPMRYSGMQGTYLYVVCVDRRQQTFCIGSFLATLGSVVIMGELQRAVMLLSLLQGRVVCIPPLPPYMAFNRRACIPSSIVDGGLYRTWARKHVRPPIS